MYHICQFKDILRKFTCLVPTYSLGAGFRGGTIKVIVLYTYMIWEGVYIMQVVVVLYIYLHGLGAGVVSGETPGVLMAENKI